jgi:hypothetical protein
MNYEQKYLKYKSKYLNLKNQSGSGKFPLGTDGRRVIVDRKALAKIISVCENTAELGGKTLYTVEYVGQLERKRESNISEDRIILAPNTFTNDRRKIFQPYQQVFITNGANRERAMIIKIRDTNGEGEFYSVRYTSRAVQIKGDGSIVSNNKDDMVEWSKINEI